VVRTANLEVVRDQINWTFRYKRVLATLWRIAEHAAAPGLAAVSWVAATTGRAWVAVLLRHATSRRGLLLADVAVLGLTEVHLVLLHLLLLAREGLLLHVVLLRILLVHLLLAVAVAASVTSLVVATTTSLGIGTRRLGVVARRSLALVVSSTVAVVRLFLLHRRLKVLISGRINLCPQISFSINALFLRVQKWRQLFWRTYNEFRWLAIKINNKLGACAPP
jgi:hypothetical protein